jgi:hypothetical protein
MIRTEQDITPEAARELRIAASLTQRKFWGSVGSNQTSGHWFEVGKRKSIPKPIRILIFLRYVAGLDMEVSTPSGASTLMHISREINARIECARAEEAVKEATRIAKEAARKAKQIAA